MNLRVSNRRPALRRWWARAVALALVSSGFALVAATTVAPAEATSTWKTFAGTGMGPIADGPAGCAAYGAARVVSFTVSGVPLGGLSGVRVTDLLVTHTYVGDLEVKLTPPDANPVVLFARTGTASEGDSSNLAGPYTFSDAATPNSWWDEALAVDTSTVIPAGRYNATTAGNGFGAGGERQSITTAFAGLGDPNGVWTLSFADHCQDDTGTVTAVNLQLQASTGLAPCAAFQDAVDLAEGQVMDAYVAITAARVAVTDAADAVGAARKTEEAATVTLNTAQGTAATATTALTGATTGVTKASAALKKAKKSHNKAKIAKATKALKAAKAKQKAAQTTASKAQGAVTTATSELGVATQDHTDRGLDLSAAQLGLDLAQDDLATLQGIVTDKGLELAQCLDS